MHARDPTLFQHQGIGTLLMEEAERIARVEHGSRKLAVISGIGVRSYCEFDGRASWQSEVANARG